MRTTLIALRQWTLAGVCFAATLHAQPSAGKYDPSTYEHSSADIAMRDGVKLHVEIFYPRGATEPLPFLLERTPYGVGESAQEITVSYKDLAEDGYIFVFEDIRGRYKSEGTFVMQRPPKPVDAPGQAIDETTDTNDSIDWMLGHIPNNNGRVGMLGVSYDGWTAAMGMLGAHKALRAVSPQASPADMFLGDDFHHNGAFRLSYGFEYAWLTEATRENSDFDTHPNYDDFWQRQAMRPYLTRVTVPTLNVAGWWDQEDFYGPVTIYRALEKHDQANRNFLVVGPWRHGGWSGGPGQTLGAIDFGSATGEYYRAKIQAP